MKSTIKLYLPNIIMRAVHIVLFSLFIGGTLKAQVSLPKYVNSFLEIGATARGIALSNAQTATIDDASAGFWNPAGLLNIKDKYAGTLMYSPYLSGEASYNYAGFATSIDQKSHLGVSVIRFAIDDIPDTRFLLNDGQINYDNVRSFSSAEYAFLLSYARKFPILKDFKFGANFKIIHKSVGIFGNAWGYGIDVGAQTKVNKFLLGLVAKDITGTFNHWSYNSDALFDTFSKTGNTIPENSIEVSLPSIHFDAALPLFYNIKKREDLTIGIQPIVGFVATFDGERNTLIRTGITSIDPRLGLELSYNNAFFVRSGLGKFQRVLDDKQEKKLVSELTFGIGVKIKKLWIDYALNNTGRNLGRLHSHTFAIHYFLGKSKNTAPRYRYEED